MFQNVYFLVNMVCITMASFETLEDNESPRIERVG